MLRISIFLFLVYGTLFGYSYSDLLIKAQNAIFPKILLLDKQLEQKLVNGEICYTIVCEASDYHTAQSLKEQMETKYRHRLGSYPLRVEVLLFSDLTQEKRTTAIYTLNSEEGIKKVAKLAKSQGI